MEGCAAPRFRNDRLHRAFRDSVFRRSASRFAVAFTQLTPKMSLHVAWSTAHGAETMVMFEPADEARPQNKYQQRTHRTSLTTVLPVRGIKVGSEWCQSCDDGRRGTARGRSADAQHARKGSGKPSTCIHCKTLLMYVAVVKARL